MGLSVPLRTDFDATRLRCLARKCGDNRQIRRLLSLAAVYDGMNRTWNSPLKVAHPLGYVYPD